MCMLHTFMLSSIYCQVIIATRISFGADLNSRFGLLTIDTLGGIPPGRWCVIDSFHSQHYHIILVNMHAYAHIHT